MLKKCLSMFDERILGIKGSLDDERVDAKEESTRWIDNSDAGEMSSRAVTNDPEVEGEVDENVWFADGLDPPGMGSYC